MLTDLRLNCFSYYSPPIFGTRSKIQPGIIMTVQHLTWAEANAESGSSRNFAVKWMLGNNSGCVSWVKNLTQLVSYSIGLGLSGISYCFGSSETTPSMLQSLGYNGSLGTAWAIYALIHYNNSFRATFWPESNGFTNIAKYPYNWRIYNAIINELLVDGVSLLCIGPLGGANSAGLFNPLTITGMVLTGSSLALSILPVGKLIKLSTSTDSSSERTSLV